jgi:hypothetical protein
MNHPAASREVSHFRDFIDFIEARFEEYNPKRFNPIIPMRAVSKEAVWMLCNIRLSDKRRQL